VRGKRILREDRRPGSSSKKGKTEKSEEKDPRGGRRSSKSWKGGNA